MPPSPTSYLHAPWHTTIPFSIQPSPTAYHHSPLDTSIPPCIISHCHTVSSGRFAPLYHCILFANVSLVPLITCYMGIYMTTCTPHEAIYSMHAWMDVVCPLCCVCAYVCACGVCMNLSTLYPPSPLLSLSYLSPLPPLTGSCTATSWSPYRTRLALSKLGATCE